MELPTLSNRLLACCSFIKQGQTVADIGCDHGYLGIYLLLKGIAKKIIAADINRQPLDSAYVNAYKYCVKDMMTFCLSDGARSIPHEFDTLVCAGMGADTIISILEGVPWLKADRYHLVLQCQSRRPELRKYLNKNGWTISREILAKDGKFVYPVMAVNYCSAAPLSPAECHISPALLASNDPLLPEFYDRVMDSLRTTVSGLAKSGGEKYEYYSAILTDLSKLEDQIYGNCCRLPIHRSFGRRFYERSLS